MHAAARPSNLVGDTPLLVFVLVAQRRRIRGQILRQIRIVRAVQFGQRWGIADPVMVDPTSGGTGLALDFIVCERDYRCVLIMPETMSVERRTMLLALGAGVLLTPNDRNASRWAFSFTLSLLTVSKDVGNKREAFLVP